MSNPVVWLDLETTGLDPEKDKILEVGLVATNDQFERIGVEDFSMVVQPHSGLDITKLNPYVVEMHAKNGLFAEIASEKGMPMLDVGTRLHSWLVEVRNVHFNTLPPHVIGEQNLTYESVKLLMAGSTVGQFDRQFFARAFPDLMHYFEYRVIDVSSVKEIVRRLYGDAACYSDTDAAMDGVGKEHRVIADIEASIAELRFYIAGHFKEAL